MNKWLPLPLIVFAMQSVKNGPSFPWLLLLSLPLHLLNVSSAVVTDRTIAVKKNKNMCPESLPTHSRLASNPSLHQILTANSICLPTYFSGKSIIYSSLMWPYVQGNIHGWPSSFKYALSQYCPPNGLHSEYWEGNLHTLNSILRWPSVSSCRALNQSILCSMEAKEWQCKLFDRSLCYSVRFAGWHALLKTGILFDKKCVCSLNFSRRETRIESCAFGWTRIRSHYKALGHWTKPAKNKK